VKEDEDDKERIAQTMRTMQSWLFKKTKMGTSGQLSRVYIQLHTDFKVQLEPYDNKNPNTAILVKSHNVP
jgi:hypothetical protein